MKRLVVRAVADADIERAQHARWLLASLRKAFDRIAAMPAAGSPRFERELDVPGLRHVATRGFPYLVVYIELGDTVHVLRVLHQRSDIPAGFLD